MVSTQLSTSSLSRLPSLKTLNTLTTRKMRTMASKVVKPGTCRLRQQERLCVRSHRKPCGSPGPPNKLQCVRTHTGWLTRSPGSNRTQGTAVGEVRLLHSLVS